MEKYTEATSGKETLVDFATQRADSILAQLSGDLVVEAETESSMGGASPNIDDGANGADQPPNMGDGENGADQPPNMGGGENGAAMQPPNMGDGENGAAIKPPGMNENMGSQGVANSNYSKETIILSSVLLLLLFGAMAFAHFFKRRGKRG